jgi:hypothetical protein
VHKRELLGEPGVDVLGSSGHAAHTAAHLAPLFIPYTAHSRVRTMIYSLCHQIFVTFDFFMSTLIICFIKKFKVVKKLNT